MFQNLKLEYANPNQDATIKKNKWKNTARYSLGADFSPVTNGKIRADLAFDQGAVPNATCRSPRAPDSDRSWIALGLGYKISREISLDIGYAH